MNSEARGASLAPCLVSSAAALSLASHMNLAAAFGARRTSSVWSFMTAPPSFRLMRRRRETRERSESSAWERAALRGKPWGGGKGA